MERLSRAATERLFVDDVTPSTEQTGLAHVYSERGECYTVDVETGACECADAEYNIDTSAGEKCKYAMLPS